MALPVSGGGYQPNTGNTAEAKISRITPTNLAAGNNNVSAAALAAGMIISAGGAGAVLTLDSGANIDAQVPDAVVGHYFDVIIANTDGANAGTYAAPADNSVTILGSNSLPAGRAAAIRFLKTGVGTWNALRIN